MSTSLDDFPKFYHHADEVYDEFRFYQSLSAIPPEIDTSELYEDEERTHIRADLLWHRLEHLRDVNGKLKFGLLANVAKLVLILPHSNADEERVFSMVRKNKTAFCANLSLDTTLPSILHCKVNCFSHIKCYEYHPPPRVLQNAKHATWQYNKEHLKS